MRLLAQITATDETLTISAAGDGVVATPTPTGWIMGRCPVDSDALVRDAASHLDRVGPIICYDAGPVQHLQFFAHPLGRGTFFFARNGTSTFIATDLADLVALTRRTRLDERIVANYFASRRRTPCDTSTFLVGIEQVPPAHVLRITTQLQQITSYWCPTDDPEYECLTRPDAVRRLRDAINDELQVGTKSRATAVLVSGGIDSGVVASMTCAVKPDVSLVCIRGPVVASEEIALQDALVAHLGRPAIMYEATPRLLLRALRERNRNAPAPSGGLFTGLYADLLAMLATNGIDVVVGGEGGDELFNPHPDIVADLLQHHQYAAAFEAVSWYASLRSERTGWRVYREYGHDALRSAPVRRSDEDRLFLRRLLGDFAANVEATFVSYRRDRDGVRGLVSRHAFEALRDLCEIPFYEAWAPPGVAAVLNPLGSVGVVRAAMSLRLEDRVKAGAGACSKLLLRDAGIGVVPRDVREAPKIGIGNLLWQMTSGQALELVDVLSTAVLRDVGIRSDPVFIDPRNVPGSVSLYWSLLLVLTLWYREVQEWLTQPLPTMMPISSMLQPVSAFSTTTVVM